MVVSSLNDVRKPFVSKMSSKTKSKIPSVQTIVSTIGSVATAAVVIRSVACDYLPPEFRNYLYLGLRKFITKFSTHMTMVIYESEGFQENEIYNAMDLYVTSRMSSEAHHMKVTKTLTQNDITAAVEVKEEFTDVFNGVKLYWSLASKKTPPRYSVSQDGMNYSTRTDLLSFELTFHRKHKDMVLKEYLPLSLIEAEAKKQGQKTVKLFTLGKNFMYRRMPWTPVNLDHPANFSTLAMDADVKEKVMTDLDRFVQRRDYHRKVGKAWKRGYLLYGPPGTGKSILIAAMANHLSFDIYDLELTEVRSNSDLRMLLLATANRSILVVEDIDCSMMFRDRAANDATKTLAEKNAKQNVSGEENKHVSSSKTT